jgi:hypothetical protein
MSCAKLAGIILRNSSMFLPLISLGNPRVALTTPALRAKKPCATWLVPGSSELRPATNTAFSQLLLNWKWMEPCGKTVPSYFWRVPATSGFAVAATRPFSRT